MTAAQAIGTATVPFAETNERAGRALTGLSAGFFIHYGGIKLFKPPVVVQATIQLGHPESTIVGIRVALLVSTLLYLVPLTSMLGAILLIGG